MVYSCQRIVLTIFTYASVIRYDTTKEGKGVYTREVVKQCREVSATRQKHRKVIQLCRHTYHRIDKIDEPCRRIQLAKRYVLHNQRRRKQQISKSNYGTAPMNHIAVDTLTKK